MPREDHVRRLEFSPSERELYEDIKTRTRHALPELFSPQTATKANYFNVLWWIDKLRKICNHGLIKDCSRVPLVRSASPCSQSLESDGETFGFALQTAPAGASSGLDLLDRVSQKLQETALKRSGSITQRSMTPDISAAQRSRNMAPTRSDDHCTSVAESPESPACASPDLFATITACNAVPTKIERLVRDLLESESDQKRYDTHRPAHFFVG